MNKTLREKGLRHMLAGIESEVILPRGLIGKDALDERVMHAMGKVPRDEFVVNNDTARNQRAPSVEVLPDGSYLVAYQSQGADGSGGAAVVDDADRSRVLWTGKEVQLSAPFFPFAPGFCNVSRFTRQRGQVVTITSAPLRTQWLNMSSVSRMEKEVPCTGMKRALICSMMLLPCIFTWAK